MAIKDTTKAACLDAMTRFDAELRGHGEWESWETNKAHKYAISEGGALYPVKQIVSMASGVPRSEFTGGVASWDANPVVEKLGFMVTPLNVSALRNPTWNRDELILALDTYVRFGGNPPGKTSVDIIELSRLLNDVQKVLGGQVSETLRNPSGVYMKLMNFRRLDPLYVETGRVGLSRGGKLEEVVWAEFHADPERLARIATAIRVSISNMGEVITDSLMLAFNGDDQFEANEGRILTVQHQRRERSREIVRRKKTQELAKDGRLACAVCEFDFSVMYGERGNGFIECHHTKPVETLGDGGKTRLSDLVLLCSNCHRMIHARRPWLTVAELRVVRLAS